MKLKKYMQRKFKRPDNSIGWINGIKYRMADDTLIMDYFIPMVIR